MARQRGSMVKWNGNARFGPESLTDLPEHGALVAATISAWAATEAHLGRVFGSLTGAKRPVTMTMYSAIRSPEVQRDIIKAAAIELLPKRYAMMACATLEVIYKAYGTRNQFAHWVWGASADPSLTALLLVEPKQFWNLHTAQLRYWHNKRGKDAIEKAGPALFMLRTPRLNLADIWVYTLADLKESRARVERAYRVAEALRRLVSGGTPQRRAIYHSLCNEPDLLSALNRVKSNWPNNRPTPRAPPDKGL